MGCSVDRGTLALVCFTLSTCGSSAPLTPPPLVAPAGPYVVVLGSAQDAGIPQIGARSANSRRARRDPRFRRYAASLLIADPASGRRWLIDASPDIRDQVELARAHPASRRRTGARPPLFDGIFLTHAHIGHYAGLMQLGREAYSAAHCQPVGNTISGAPSRRGCT